MANQQFGLILFAISSSLLTTASIIWYMRRKKKPLEYIEVGKVGEICIYPVKSCGGISVQEAECTARGIKTGQLRDRKWMLVDDEDRNLAAKKEPSVALIKTSLSADGQNLVLRADGQPTVQLPLVPDTTAQLVKAKLHESIVYGYDCGEKVRQWLSNIITDKAYRMLVHEDNLQGRKFVDNPVWKERFTSKDQALYHYMTQFHVANTASLDDLNSRLETPIGMQQFRANIIISESNAFAEDKWAMLKIGDACLSRTHDCGRCPITMIDRKLGTLRKAEPLKTLRQYRMLDKSHPDSKFQKSPIFGVNFKLVTGGSIKVGDTVYAVLQ
ncbi:mitochondrial amidoxime-reducing component 1-like [Anneissia japonica]|uniref:mitochondrial amidoxime-reducing component 1-like n=1 Tax=Anneissia japonica TaxID=1529436 RepID=UPI00142589BB|nr:mitochondrial amidoxime-reducing component 1-like [Anneissia japonica]